MRSGQRFEREKYMNTGGLHQTQKVESKPALPEKHVFDEIIYSTL